MSFAVSSRLANPLTEPGPDHSNGESTEKRQAGHHVRGVLWLTIQSLLSKVLQMLSLIPLTWLLEPEDLGLIGLVTAVTAFSGLVQQLGIREILIHRQNSFDYWSNPAFWLAATLGVFASLTLALIAFCAVTFFDNDRLQYLLLAMSAALPFQAVAAIPEAKLYIQLRFRLVASVGIILAVMQSVLCISLAWLGMGAYSFVIPLIIVSVVRAVLLWCASRNVVKPRLDVGSWKHLISDSGIIFLTNLSYIVVSQGDYLILGLMTSKQDLGYYFVAFNLAMAPLHLFAMNLNSVLFPSLSSLRSDPLKQTAVCQQVSRMLALVVTPISFVQALLADPIVRLLFDAAWHPIIPLIQVLSLGMALRCIGWPSASLLQAQGRFGVRLTLAAVWAVLLLAVVALGEYIGGILGAAVCVSLAYTVIGPITLYVTFRPDGFTRLQLIEACARPVVAALAVSLPAWIVTAITADTSPLLRLVVTLAVAATLFMPAIRLADPQSAQELIRRLLSSLYSNVTHRVA